MKKQLRGIRAYKADFRRIKRKTERASKREGRKVDTAEVLNSALDLHDAFEKGQLIFIEEASR